MYDVIVAGAGPAGTAAAQACASAGLSTLVVEEHGTIGYPVQCAGLLSLKAFEECRVSKRPVIATVAGARVISSLGDTLAFLAKTRKAYVVDRGMLDREMADAAARAGAEFRMKTAVCGVSGTTLKTRGVNGSEEHSFRVLIAADGPRSTIARLFRMERAKTYLAGIQADIPWSMDPDFVEIYPDAAPDFFGYAIPIGSGRARIGLCTSLYAKERFARFLRHFTDTAVHLVTGTVPLGVMPKTFGPRTLFCGDAAGFAKPTSGGGVYTGIRSARHAAETAIACCRENRFDDVALARYEDLWRKDLGLVLEGGYRFFRLRQQLSQEDTARLIRTLNNPDIIDAIVQYGDMDRPGLLIQKLLLKPSVLAALGSLLRPGFLSLLQTGKSG